MTRIQLQRLARIVRSVHENGVLFRFREASGQFLGRLVRGSAEALVCMLALLGFGLMWAGVTSLGALDRTPHTGVTTFPATSEGPALGTEARSLRSWSSADARLSSPDHGGTIQLAASRTHIAGHFGRAASQP
jgi:hypothetical protein